MATEIELKLRMTPRQLTKLKRHPMFKEHQVSRPVVRHLYNIYYDTPQLDLQKSVMTLRLRRVGRQWVQTLKSGRAIKAGLHQRAELEVPVASAELDFSTLQVTDESIGLPKSLQSKLQPIFITDFHRTSRMLLWQGAQIELCMDQGVARTEHASTEICEAELELKYGQPEQLFELALAIIDVVPFELEVTSKAERGYSLVLNSKNRPVKAVVTSMAKSATLADILQSSVWSCLLHLQSNLSGAMVGDDAEFLHQLRVAMRRLRVVLRTIQTLQPDENLFTLNKEIGDLCTALGRIREWDVFIAQTLRPVSKHFAGHADFQVLLEGSERQREACYEAILGGSQLRELQRLVLRISIWMYGVFGQQKSLPPARKFAMQHLNKLSGRLKSLVKQVRLLDAPQLHEMRILAKKLRYSCELFSGLYGRKKAQSYLGALSDLQEILGELNDGWVSARLLDELAANQVAFDDREAIMLVNGWVACNQSHHFAGLTTVIQHFLEQSAFWKNS